ncbi:MULTISPECIES: hypothetical protein [Streptomyces]|uniref:hypothetical protein n=1 Tax=Streptomyces TaxID=1883 RepID=UPI00131A7F14|nr:hypothetical protein [Streptomyces flavochromogenes]
MKYVIASATKGTVDVCRAALASYDCLEFRVGIVPDTGAGCDAAVVWWPLAHEQYGGIPEAGLAQVLLNTTDGDVPEIILATPPGPGRTSGVGATDPEVEDHMFTTLDACIREYLKTFPECRESAVILIHLDAAGLDRGDMKARVRGLERFLRAER